MGKQVTRSFSGQIIPKDLRGYNDRLFNKGWRRYLHESRYLWMQQKIRQLNIVNPSIIELGCFDAKNIEYLPNGFSRYVGYDANWENGLHQGMQRWNGDAKVKLIESHKVEEFNQDADQFDISIALETLEHLRLDDLDKYIQKIASATKKYFFVSVPYERGLPL